MAILTELQRDEIWAQFMTWLSSAGNDVALLKGDIRDAVTDIDAGVAENLSMVDSFLAPETAAGLDTAAKNYLFSLVVARRLQEGI
jgi:hypothetical protein